MVLHIMECGKERDKRAHEAAWEFMSKKFCVHKKLS